MSWHEEIVVLEFVDDKGEKITDLEVTKAEFVVLQKKAVEEGVDIGTFISKLLVEGNEEWETE